MVNQSYSEALSSKESIQWKKVIIEEMVSLEKNQTCSLVRISARKKASQRLWMFKVKEEQNGKKRYKARLVVKGFQPKRGEPSYVGALNDTSTQHKSEDSWNEEPCRDVHQVGDEREVEVLCIFKWPLSELITEDGFLPERVQRVPYVRRYRKVRAVAFLKGRWFEVYKDYLRRRAVVQLQVNPDSMIGAIYRIELAVVVLVAALAPEFVLGFDPLKSGLSQLDIQSAPLGLQLVSA
ncbi:hypothetical protein Tco_0610992 [Tanacetum coccineum]